MSKAHDIELLKQGLEGLKRYTVSAGILEALKEIIRQLDAPCPRSERLFCSRCLTGYDSSQPGSGERHFCAACNNVAIAWFHEKMGAAPTAQAIIAEEREAIVKLINAYHYTVHSGNAHPQYLGGWLAATAWNRRLIDLMEAEATT